MAFAVHVCEGHSPNMIKKVWDFKILFHLAAGESLTVEEHIGLSES